jgi:hypothetical protein
MSSRSSFAWGNPSRSGPGGLRSADSVPRGKYPPARGVAALRLFRALGAWRGASYVTFLFTAATHRAPSRDTGGLFAATHAATLQRIEYDANRGAHAAGTRALCARSRLRVRLRPVQPGGRVGRGPFGRSRGLGRGRNANRRDSSGDCARRSARWRRVARCHVDRRRRPRRSGRRCREPRRGKRGRRER